MAAKKDPQTLKDFRPNETALIRCWGQRREVRVIDHDDCGLTTLQNMRTLTVWKTSSFTGATDPVIEYAKREEMLRVSNVSHFEGALLGYREWYGWRNGVMLYRDERYKPKGYNLGGP